MTEEQQQAERLHEAIKLDVASTRQSGQEATQLMARSLVTFSEPVLIEVVKQMWWAQWHVGEANQLQAAADMVLWSIRREDASVYDPADAVGTLRVFKQKAEDILRLARQNVDAIRDYNPGH